MQGDILHSMQNLKRGFSFGSQYFVITLIIDNFVVELEIFGLEEVSAGSRIHISLAGQEQMNCFIVIVHNCKVQR